MPLLFFQVNLPSHSSMHQPAKDPLALINCGVYWILLYLLDADAEIMEELLKKMVIAGGEENTS
jgi:hypothetical protein